MQNPDLLKLNYLKEESTLQILPKFPLLSSHPLGWDGMVVEHHSIPAWEMPEHALAQHGIGMNYSNTEGQLERVLDGRRQIEPIGRGLVAIAPAHVAHRVSWNQELEGTILLLEPTYLAQVAYETTNGDRVELIPTFGKVDPFIHQILRSLNAELAAPHLGSRLYVNSLTTALSIHLLRHYCTRNLNARGNDDGLPASTLSQVIEYIHAHLDQELGLAELAAIAHLSPHYFTRLFKQSTGVTPHQFVIRCRVERAKALLLAGKDSIAEIAQQVGFANQAHLTVHIKRSLGVTPKMILEQRKNQ